MREGGVDDGKDMVSDVEGVRSLGGREMFSSMGGRDFCLSGGGCIDGSCWSGGVDSSGESGGSGSGSVDGSGGSSGVDDSGGRVIYRSCSNPVDATIPHPTDRIFVTLSQPSLSYSPD